MISYPLFVQHPFAITVFGFALICTCVGVLVFAIGLVNVCLTLIPMLVKGIGARIGWITGTTGDARREMGVLKKGFLNMAGGVALFVVGSLLHLYASSLVPDWVMD